MQSNSFKRQRAFFNGAAPPSLTHPNSLNSSMSTPKPTIRTTDGILFVGGVFLALLFLYSLSSFMNPNPKPAPSPNFQHSTTENENENGNPKTCFSGFDFTRDPTDYTFYDDPNLSYSIGKPVKNWDGKSKDWLRKHPSFIPGASERVVLVTGSQPSPCRSPTGDHLLLRFLKNKVDYCRIHGYDIFYNNVLLHPKMHTYWAKLPVIRSAMLTHPEAEWIWWVDSDALITDMEFKLPLERYKAHNLVVHGWAHLIHNKKSWTGLNAGVFLIRNCQWALDFMEVWAEMGPQSPDYVKWGHIQRSIFKDKLFPESDDQTGLAYLIYKEKEKYADKIYLEGEYYLQGYWVDIVDTYRNISHKYEEMERGVRRLRRRHAEKVSECYSAQREEYLKEAGNGRGSWRRPFITHFTGCQPCSGKYNAMYTRDQCWNGMIRALNFADNQVLRSYGFVHPDLLDSGSVVPLPFDHPAA